MICLDIVSNLLPLDGPSERRQSFGLGCRARSQQLPSPPGPQLHRRKQAQSHSLKTATKLSCTLGQGPIYQNNKTPILKHPQAHYP